MKSHGFEAIVAQGFCYCGAVREETHTSVREEICGG